MILPARVSSCWYSWKEHMWGNRQPFLGFLSLNTSLVIFFTEWVLPKTRIRISWFCHVLLMENHCSVRRIKGDLPSVSPQTPPPAPTYTHSHTCGHTLGDPVRESWETGSEMSCAQVRWTHRFWLRKGLSPKWTGFTQESHQARRLTHTERGRLPAQPQSCLRIGPGGGGRNVRGPRDYVE